eukprot:6213267-Pleurochrysis_carterae.AAC.2
MVCVCDAHGLDRARDGMPEAVFRVQENPFKMRLKMRKSQMQAEGTDPQCEALTAQEKRAKHRLAFPNTDLTRFTPMQAVTWHE